METLLPPEVPAYIRHEKHIANRVQVEGGTNWDFSRSAVATPIVPSTTGLPLLDNSYPTLASVECSTFVVSVEFGRNSAVLPASAQRTLKTLSPADVYRLEGHALPKESKAGTLAEKRDAAVKAYLLKQGREVSAQSLTGTESASKNKSARVDVFKVEKGAPSSSQSTPNCER